MSAFDISSWCYKRCARTPFRDLVLLLRVVHSPDREIQVPSGMCLSLPPLQASLVLDHLGPVTVGARLGGSPVLDSVQLESEAQRSVHCVQEVDLHASAL
jgi:hypothetical protein